MLNSRGHGERLDTVLLTLELERAAEAHRDGPQSPFIGTATVTSTPGWARDESKKTHQTF